MNMAKHKFSSYEGLKPHDNFIQLPQTLLMHENFLNLHYSSKVLYIYFKSWAKGRQQFEYPESLGKKIFKSNTTFWNALRELEDIGFIESVRRCKTSKKPNIYKFSDKWHKNL